MLKYMIPAVLLSAVFASPALAREAPAAVHVAYHDLDLQSPSGVQLLDRRIAWAIAAVCPDFSGLDMARKRVVSRCRTAKRAEVAGQRATALASAARGNRELESIRAPR